MVVSVCTAWTNLTVFCLFIAIISVNSTESTMSDVANSTTTSTEPTSTPTQSYYRPTEQPPVAAEALPASGSLLTPVAGADRLCPCDEHTAVCDINCCCDRECNEEVALFTSCSLAAVRSGSRQLCNQDVAHYSLRTTIDGYSELQVSVQMETNYDIFCIQSQNRFDGLSHPSPSLPTDSNFDSLFSQFISFMFGSESSDEVLPAEVQALSGYQFGDVLATAEQSGQKGIFYLPAPSVTADCVNNSPAAFLKDQSSQCSQHVVLDRDCGSLQALRMDTYTNIHLFAGRNIDAEVVPVDVASVISQSIEGAQAELTVSEGMNLRPVLITPTLCANVVLKEDGGERTIHYSGNPGYVIGVPLMSGDRTTDGITRSINLRDTLSLLHSTKDQDCLWGPHMRSPVLFGLDFVSGCTLRLEDITNCSLISQLLLEVLRGPNFPQYVASFGNSPLENVLDWVPIKTKMNPMEAQSCNIPLSLHLEIEWTKYGSLVNPQAQIVNIREVIETNHSSLALFSGGSSILQVRSSVAFIPVSATALPGYRVTPSINAKLPFDFFFPFV
ncbi:tectonic-1 isoform 2-T2 [Anableps anableps]